MNHHTLPIDMLAALREGKLEQTCRQCGRWEAAGYHCSWCGAPTGADDWYRNNDVAERRRRLPAAAPVNPPAEYRHSNESWPETWGPYPGETRQRGPRAEGTRVKAGSAAFSESVDLRLGL